MDIGIIFDMDGVLVDSGAPHLKSWQLAAEERGRRITAEEFKGTFGRPSRDIIRILFGAEVSPTEIRQIDDRKEALYRDLVRNDLPKMPGAQDLVLALHARGVRVAIGSSGPPENVRLVVDGLGIAAQLGAIVTGEDVKNGKPDPEVFLTAAARLGLSPERCVVVEDAMPGIEAAHRAKMKVIALASTHRPDELGHADAVVTALGAIDVPLLERLLG